MSCPSVFHTTTTFVLDSPEKQKAANMIYSQKVAADAAFIAAGSKKVYNFKTDWERMQAKIGQFGLNSNVEHLGLSKPHKK